MVPIQAKQHKAACSECLQAEQQVEHNSSSSRSKRSSSSSSSKTIVKQNPPEHQGQTWSRKKINWISKCKETEAARYSLFAQWTKTVLRQGHNFFIAIPLQYFQTHSLNICLPTEEKENGTEYTFNTDKLWYTDENERRWFSRFMMTGQTETKQMNEISTPL